MKIKWILRLKNKVTLTALIGGCVTLIYQILGWFGIVPSISPNEILNAASLLINMLVILGIVVDPTTAGVEDTDTVMDYAEPRREIETAADDEGMEV